jgi:hypothetical protein
MLYLGDVNSQSINDVHFSPSISMLGSSGNSHKIASYFKQIFALYVTLNMFDFYENYQRTYYLNAYLGQIFST